MTLLTSIQDVCDELGIVKPTAVVTSQDRQIIQLLALANRAGDELMRLHDWQQLQKEHRFYTTTTTKSATVTASSASVTVADTSDISTNYGVSGTGILADSLISSIDSPTTFTMTAQASASGTPTLTFAQCKYNMPTGFNRMTSNTEFDKSGENRIYGNKSPQYWQDLKALGFTASPYYKFRQQGNQFVVYPFPSDGLRFGFEYVTGYWAQSAAGTDKAKFTADDDVTNIPEHLVTLLTKVKFYEAKGLDASALSMDYMKALELAKGNDTPAPNLNMSSDYVSPLLGNRNTPEINYGS